MRKKQKEIIKKGNKMENLRDNIVREELKLSYDSVVKELEEVETTGKPIGVVSWDNYDKEKKYLEELKKSFEEILPYFGITIKEKITQEMKSDNFNAYHRAEQEGWGYAVMDYTNGDEFKDSNTRKLWKESGQKLNELRNYLIQFKDEGF